MQDKFISDSQANIAVARSSMGKELEEHKGESLLFIHLFIHEFNYYFLSSCCMLGTVLGVWHTTRSKPDKSLPP